MKTIIAGSRHITDAAVIITVVEQSRFEITEVVSGAGLGVDRFLNSELGAPFITSIFFIPSNERYV